MKLVARILRRILVTLYIVKSQWEYNSVFASLATLARSQLCLWMKKIFESYFRDRLTFLNIDSRTSRRIYRLALLLRAPETLSSLSKSRISIFNAHLTLLVRRMTSHNSIGKYRHLVNWLGVCLGTEHRRLQTRLVECRTGKKWMSGAPLFTRVIFTTFITLLMFVLNFVGFCFILYLIYSS